MIAKRIQLSRDAERLLASRPTAINTAELELRYAAHCLRQMFADRDDAAHWLAEADRHITSAWQRLDEGGDK